MIKRALTCRWGWYYLMVEDEYELTNNNEARLDVVDGGVVLINE